MERSVVQVKSEVQENGDILLFYVDENGMPIENDGGMVTTIDQEQLHQLQENYILEEIPSDHEVVENFQDLETVENNVEVAEESVDDGWLDEEIRRLLVFYIDNKKTFLNGSFTKAHLWSVACQMTLDGKNPASCELQLNALKQKYEQIQQMSLKQQTDPRVWPYYDLCDKAFHDDNQSIYFKVEQVGRHQKIQINSQPSMVQTSQAGGPPEILLKKFKKTPDPKVKQMLEMYLQHKREFSKRIGQQKAFWDKLGLQLGEAGDYVHKKFLNYKRHYICMLEKRHAGGEVDWPYMALFDSIYHDDADFQRKYGQPLNQPKQIPPQTTANSVSNNLVPVIDWNETEKTVLVKYYFDCFDEFEDPTIPKAFLWNEVGRLLDKKAEDCKKKYQELRNEHLSQYIQKGYTIRLRKPIAIMFDNIVSREVEKKFYDPAYQMAFTNLQWKTEKIDELVQFFFDNIELFKDPMCHYVCWAAVAAKIKETVKACKDVWNDLTSLYKSILNDKKEDSDLQIDWRYIDIFDKIFDYGLDTKLLEGYENKVPILTRQKRATLGRNARDENDTEALSDVEAMDVDENIDNQVDPKTMKILEYYMKNKDKFTANQKRKHTFWDPITQELNMSSADIAAKFKRIKVLYLNHIQKEINSPEQPILWPYYAICKKVFGYRLIKNKLKSSNKDSDERNEWAPKDIKKLINFARQNLEQVETNVNDSTKWAKLGQDLGKSEADCREMFLQLREYYVKIKTMKITNPDCNVNWKYYKLFNELYNNAGGSLGSQNVEDVDTSGFEETENQPMETKGDDEFQYIIVAPEGQQINDQVINEATITIKDDQLIKKEPQSEPRILWTKKQKIDLLTAYQEYIKENKEKVINTKELWQTISQKLNRKPLSCKRMYTELKSKYENMNKEGSDDKIINSPVFSIIAEILKIKPKFVRPAFTDDDVVLREQTTYTDVDVPLWSVEIALKYYLEHVEEFVNPKYDKKQAWIGLAKASSLVLSKAFKKINYLKQFYNSETNEVEGKPVAFGDMLKEILEKEFICKIAIGDITDPLSTNENTDEVVWTDDDTKQLLMWYLENLEMFKNPKYNQNYLWLEVPSVLNKSPLACSRKMAEIRSQYSSMVKENPGALNSWSFYELCQKIYGTGKKGTEQ